MTIFKLNENLEWITDLQSLRLQKKIPSPNSSDCLKKTIIKNNRCSLIELNFLDYKGIND